jgi:hypothetical protein
MALKPMPYGFWLFWIWNFVVASKQIWWVSSLRHTGILLKLFLMQSLWFSNALKAVLSVLTASSTQTRTAQTSKMSNLKQLQSIFSILPLKLVVESHPVSCITFLIHNLYFFVVMVWRTELATLSTVLEAFRSVYGPLKPRRSPAQGWIFFHLSR